jgi:small subunit ribosomal protein S20
MRAWPALALCELVQFFGPILTACVARIKIGILKMANSPQAKKRARQIERRTVVNKNRRSRIRSFLRKVEEAILSGDKEAASAALKVAQPEIMRGVTKGIFHKNTAARKVSRLTSRVKAVS